MKHTKYSSVLSIILLTSGTPVFSASAADGKLAAEAQQAVQVLQTRDSTLTNLLTSAAGYVVFPGVGKGGLVFGGEYGKGIVYEKSKPTGEAKLTEINVGPQIGGQSFYEVIFFETTEALANFKEGNLEMSAELSAVAAKEGVALHTRYSQGIVVFVLPKSGLMLQTSVGGQKFKYKPLIQEGPQAGQDSTHSNSL